MTTKQTSIASHITVCILSGDSTNPQVHHDAPGPLSVATRPLTTHPPSRASNYLWWKKDIFKINSIGRVLHTFIICCQQTIYIYILYSLYIKHSFYVSLAVLLFFYNCLLCFLELLSCFLLRLPLVFLLDGSRLLLPLQLPPPLLQQLVLLIPEYRDHDITLTLWPHSCSIQLIMAVCAAGLVISLIFTIKIFSKVLRLESTSWQSVCPFVCHLVLSSLREFKYRHIAQERTLG